MTRGDYRKVGRTHFVGTAHCGKRNYTWTERVGSDNAGNRKVRHTKVTA